MLIDQFCVLCVVSVSLGFRLFCAWKRQTKLIYKLVAVFYAGTKMYVTYLLAVLPLAFLTII